MNSKQLNIVLGAAVVALLGVVGYMALKDDSQNYMAVQPNQTQMEWGDKESPPAEPPFNIQSNEPEEALDLPLQTGTSLKAYTNKYLGFSLQYPSDAKPTIELNDEYNRLTGFGKLPGKYFEVRLFEYDNVGNNEGYLGAVVVQKNVKIGGATGYKAVSETGYGDAGVQGKPYVDFGVKYKGVWYHILFYGDAKVSAEEQQILETFKFTN